MCVYVCTHTYIYMCIQDQQKYVIHLKYMHMQLKYFLTLIYND